jgi:hypothetical protein
MFPIGTMLILANGPGRIDGVEHLYRADSGRREMRYKVRAEAADQTLSQTFVWSDGAVPLTAEQVVCLAGLGSILCRAQAVRRRKSPLPRPTRPDSRQPWYREARRRRWWRTRKAKSAGLKVRRWWRAEGKLDPIVAL